MQNEFFLKISVYDYCNNQSVQKQAAINEGKETFSSSFPWLGAFCINLISLIPTQSHWLMSALWSMLSWADILPAVAWLGPGPAGHSSSHWRKAHHLPHENPFVQRPQHPLLVAVETTAVIHPLSNWWRGFATPMGVWKGRQGELTEKVGKNNV